MKITSWNINSVRLRLPLLEQVFATVAPDVICLQETKCVDGQFPTEAIADMGYPYQAYRGEKSYNGVAILSRLPLRDASHELWAGKEDCRHISAIVNDIRIHNFYIPAGGDVPERDENRKFGHKLDFVKEVTAYFAAQDQGPAVMVGDLNIAPLAEDVWSTKQLRNVVSHTDLERERLLSLIAKGGWHDAIRGHFGPEEILYSWWSYRARDYRASNRGRRLDHIFVTNDLADKVTSAEIFAEARGWEKPSDHVPISITL